MGKYLKNKFVMGSMVWILLCLTLVFVSNYKSNSPEGTIKRLEQAFNSRSDKQLLKCFDSSANSAYNLAKTFDKDINVMEALDISPVNKIKLLVESVEMISEEEADVSCIIIMTEKGYDQPQVDSEIFELKKEDGTWVISF